MSTVAGALEPHDLAVSALAERIADSASGDAAVVSEFARRYLNRVPLEYLESHSDEAIIAQVQSLFEFADRHDGATPEVRVYTPTVADHGYTTGGTVVEVICPDMSFLVDSLTNEIQGKGYQVSRVFHPVLGIQRAHDGRIVEILSTRATSIRESLQHIELGRTLTPDEIEDLEAALRIVLRDVRNAVTDFEQMQGAVYRMIRIVRDSAARYPQADIAEAVAFCEWLLDMNFVFLGYREYSIVDSPEGRAVVVDADTGLGILRRSDRSAYSKPVLLDDMSPELRTRYEGGQLVVITKTNRLSRVHRRAKMDYIGVRRIGPDGEVLGEARLLGLFASKAYMTPVRQIPILRSKLEQILEAEDTMEGSHYYKELVQLFESFPKDELFSTPTEDIRRSMVGLVELQEREQVRLFVRRDLLQRSVSLLVVMPRDRFDANVRRQLQDLFLERLNGTSIDYRLALGETDTARLHFTVWVSDSEAVGVGHGELEAEVLAITRTWEERISELMMAEYGADTGAELAARWGPEFPEYYRNSVPTDLVLGDILRLQELADSGGRFVVGLQNETTGDERLTRLAVYKADGKLMLSEVMPTLEALGLRVVEEVPTRLVTTEDIVIHDFGVQDASGEMLGLGRCAERVAETVAAILDGRAESDSLNRLVITTDLTYRQVRILRAYRTYWRRVRPGFTAQYINDVCAAHPEIAADLIDLFETRFDPNHPTPGPGHEVVARIERQLDSVRSLDEDRILRALLGLIMATVRTNTFRPERRCLSFKFRSVDVPGMPMPAPLYEIFVYDPAVEGIHLRGGKVARGGLRWSTRREDYRTEVLGLMKAQMTKNAVIVPTGSKGGFVLRQSPADPSQVGEAVLAGYVKFIGGLLDVTDNLVGGEVVHPADVVVHDEDDPYLVVAADKGTAAFSDTANAIAAEYGFWLGDAFASGGSAGYDHKVLGITARGAWESVRWHLREMGLDPMVDPISVVGIGDMSGDVFGNGMLYSPKLRLVAAFDHRDIFIDPDPDAALAFAERRRLFDLPRSSWQDYDPALISAGGGVWSRESKLIEISAEAAPVLGLDGPTRLTPDEVIQAILRSPVDLLWNGGIGTYVKATHETHEQVGDRVNDAVRVDAIEMRCKVVGEGGNLGLTQPGRIEFATKGGRINTDFIDNSGGVNCSDREVNLKILLGLAEERGELDRRGRDELIASVSDDVVRAILYDNFLQAQILAQAAAKSRIRLDAHEDLMMVLESKGLLVRHIERLPSSEEMGERTRAGLGLTSPELAVLLAYAKRQLRDWLLASDLPDSGEFDSELFDYFPAPVVERFGHLIPEHPLRRELIATLLANQVVNAEGITFVTRLMVDTASSPARVVRAYHIARSVTDATERWAQVEELSGTLPAEVERELLGGIDRLVEAVTRWHLNTSPTEALDRVVEPTQAAFRELAASIEHLGPSGWGEEREALIEEWIARGVPGDIARRHVYADELVHAPDIIDLAHRTGYSLAHVARIFLGVGPAFQINWLEDELARVPASNRWQRGATQAVADDVVTLRRQLAERVLVETGTLPADEALATYVEARTPVRERLTRMLRSLSLDGVDDISGLVVAIRQIRSLLV